VNPITFLLFKKQWQLLDMVVLLFNWLIYICYSHKCFVNHSLSRNNSDRTFSKPATFHADVWMFTLRTKLSERRTCGLLCHYGICHRRPLVLTRPGTQHSADTHAGFTIAVKKDEKRSTTRRSECVIDKIQILARRENLFESMGVKMRR
jgi:hypothetical protein